MKKKILLIDDDAIYIYLLKYQLKKHRIVGEIVTACNGSEALEIIKRGLESGELPQVIISDIEMPLMSGISFYKEIARLKLIDYAVTRVVLNSCNSQYSVLDWSVEIPHIVYFSKPLKKDDLLTILAD